MYAQTASEERQSLVRCVVDGRHMGFTMNNECMASRQAGSDLVHAFPADIYMSRFFRLNHAKPGGGVGIQTLLALRECLMYTSRVCRARPVRLTTEHGGYVRLTAQRSAMDMHPSHFPSREGGRRQGHVVSIAASICTPPRQLSQGMRRQAIMVNNPQHTAERTRRLLRLGRRGRTTRITILSACVITPQVVNVPSNRVKHDAYAFPECFVSTRPVT